MHQFSPMTRSAGTWLVMSGWLFACSSEGPSSATPATGGATTPIGRGGAQNRDSIGGNSGAGEVGGAGNYVTVSGGAGNVGTGGQTSAAQGGLSATTRSNGGGNARGGNATVGGAVAQSRGGATNNGTMNNGGNAASSNTTRGGVSGNGTGGNAKGGVTNGGAATGGVANATTSTGGTTTSGTNAGGTNTGGTSATSTLCPGATKTITVAADGAGDYSTIAAAVNAIASNNTKPIQISLRPGTYNEKVTINKPFVCLIGESATSTIITNTNGTSIVTGGTVIVTGSDFSAANVTFQNSAPLGSAQAVALMAQGQRQQFRNCRFVSYQDTLYTNTGTQYFKDCYIQGNTDFIFGDATAVFENCTINSVSEGTAVTAPRTPQNTTYGFVFLGGAVTANPTTATVRANHVHLGRPWGPYAAAAFIRVDLGVHVASAGWTTMSNNDLSNTRFSEYKSTGAGANTTDPTRSSRQLSDAQAANYTVKNVLSPWVPGYSQ